MPILEVVHSSACGGLVHRRGAGLDGTFSPFHRQGPGFLLLVALLLLFSGLAQATSFMAAPRVGVLTMGPGEAFWERFGHDAIVIDSPGQAGPISYNFGYFDLDEPGFVGRFAKGEMRYMLVALPLEQDLAYYREVGRSARVQWLNLAPAQANALAAALAENAKPEHAHYRYDYFTSNCTTRVRDALDRALGGTLHKQLEGRSSGDSWRSESLRLASPAAWMWLTFDVLLGPAADRPLTRWEVDFIPRRLADDLRNVIGNDGRPLVAAEVELLPQRQAAEPADHAIALWPWLLAGVLLAGLVRAVGNRRPRSLAAAALLFWLLCGLVGAVLALAWLGTAHQAIWANRNLLLFNPLCLLLLPGAWAVLRGRAAPRPFRRLLVAVCVLAAFTCLPLWLQVLPQRNGHWIALLLPLHYALAKVWTTRNP
ncbi:MAG: DUF4105 domain-containing protein [Xanthomonadaceae bacterium]|nr:DUF4105 domain-containing protein [Xanthomonadaceae bacterium]